jgi:hypothetical protein
VTLFCVTLIGLLLFLMDVAVTWLRALAAGPAFVWRESRVADPFLGVRLLAGRRPLLAT